MKFIDLKQKKQLINSMWDPDWEVRKKAILSYFKFHMNNYGYSDKSINEYWSLVEGIRNREKDERVRISYDVNLYLSGKEKGLDNLLRKSKDACERKDYDLVEVILYTLKKIENIHNIRKIKEFLSEIYDQVPSGQKAQIEKKSEILIYPRVLLIDKNHTLSMYMKIMGNYSKHYNYIKFYSAGIERIRKLWEYDYIIPIGVEGSRLAMVTPDKWIFNFEKGSTTPDSPEEKIHELIEQICDEVLKRYSLDGRKSSRMEATRLLAVAGNEKALAMLEAMQQDLDIEVRKQAILEYYNGSMSLYGYNWISSKRYLKIIESYFIQEEEKGIKLEYYKKMNQAGNYFCRDFSGN